MISLDGTWEFQHDPAGDLSPAQLGPMRPITVPSPWQAQFEDLRLTSGVAWYRCSFRTPAGPASAERGGTVLLRFGAVDYYAEVWLNGRRLGDHEGGFLPFAFEVQDDLRLGALNELIVRVVDPGPDTAETFPEFRFAEIPQGKQDWYGPIGGIWQSVTLEQRGSTYIQSLRLTADPTAEEVEAVCEVIRPNTTGQLTVRVFDPSGVIVGETTLSLDPTQATYRTHLSVAHPERWDPDHPALYRAEAAIIEPAGPVDQITESFGFRTIEARDGEILLNGQPIYLRGALDQDYYPSTIYTPPSDEFIRDRLRKAKELGLNCLRCHIKAPDPRYLNEADRLGLLIWVDLPSWGGHLHPATDRPGRTELAARRGLETLEGMIRRDWNHPSLICWSLINEDWGTHLSRSAEDRAWLGEAFDRIKAYDPQRLVVDNSACRGNFHGKSDLDDFHFFWAIPDHAAHWSETTADFANRPAWTYSPHGDAVRSFQEPLVVSEFGNWGLPNLAKLIDSLGGEPWWFDTGANWGSEPVRGLVQPRGVQERIDALGLDQVFGSAEGLARASQEQEYQALKYEIEDLRRHAQIKGYVITELTDVHWECNGLLDLCNNPKSFHHTLGAINADDVIVPTIHNARRAYWSGEEVSIDLALSHFSARDLSGAMLHWRAEPGEAGGRLGPISPLPRGQVGHPGALRFGAPTVDAPTVAKVTFELRDAAGAVIARNDLDLYLYPLTARRAAPGRTIAVIGPDAAAAALIGRLTAASYRVVDWRQADLIIGLGFDDQLAEIARAGKRVLAIVEEAGAMTSRLGRLAVIERKGSGYEGDWASSFSWIYANRLIHRAPAGPRLDWAFGAIIPEQVITGLRATELAQDGLVGLFLGWVQKPAGLALQARLGRGILGLTTLRLASGLSADDPTATVLIHDLIAHLGADGCRPTLAID